MLRENNVRAGFFERAQYLSVTQAPADIDATGRDVCVRDRLADQQRGPVAAVASGRLEGWRGPAGPRHDEEPRGSRLLPDVRAEGTAQGATQGRGSDSASEGHDRPARVLPRRADKKRRGRVLVRACDRAQWLLP